MGVDVRNCPRCGRLFAYQGREVCPVCVREEEEQFERVRAYLRRFPGATLEQIEEATEVPAEVVLGFLRQGRLIPTEALQGFLFCQRCGTHIDKGYMCKKCSQELAAEVGEYAEKRRDQEQPSAPGAEPGKIVDPRYQYGGRMHVADIVKRRPK